MLQCRYTALRRFKIKQYFVLFLVSREQREQNREQMLLFQLCMPVENVLWATVGFSGVQVLWKNRNLAYVRAV